MNRTVLTARRRLSRSGVILGVLAAPVVHAPAVAGPTIAELVEVADIASLSMSPQGDQVAFRIERASIERNSYLLEWYVADLHTGAITRVAGGGAPIYGDAGPLEPASAIWSPDGRFVYYRALIDDVIGLWRAAVDGSGHRAVIVEDADVERLTAGSNPSFLTYELGPSRDAIARAERREYDEGVLVDASVDLAQSVYRGGSVKGRMASQRLVGRWYGRAGLLWRVPRQRFRLDLTTLETTAIGTVLPTTGDPLSPTRDVTLELTEPGRPPVRVASVGDVSLLQVEIDGSALSCGATVCRAQRIVALAWRPDSDELVFTTQDEHFRQSLHAWNLRNQSVRTVVKGDGLISGSRDGRQPCVLSSDAAVCVTAGAVTPPRLERIDLASGARTVLLDPNATLRRHATALVDQLSWTLTDGREAAATLLRPRRASEPLPLFVTYYHCPGFLRGGTGDEFPLGPLADAGFAVACINMIRLDDPGDALERYGSALAAVESLVRFLAESGRIDPQRVGMGGFSAGSEATMWTAMNTDVLAAAAIASPQYEPSAYWTDARAGRDYAQVLREFTGLGRPDETPERWQLISPALNVERIEVPLLMQLPETEARAATELFARLSATATPVEMYVFPDEAHVKMQPRHRNAVYRRGLDWFRYWLQRHIDPDPIKAEQYDRWEALRQRRDQAHASNARSQFSAEESSSSRM